MARRRKARLGRDEACAVLKQLDIPRTGSGADFFVLSSSKVTALLEQADYYGYRKPKNANGSRGRYFFARLQRACK